MGKYKAFHRRLQSARQKFISLRNFIIGGLIVFILWIWNIFVDTAVGELLMKAISEVVTQLIPIVSEIFQKYPYLFVFTTFCVFVFLLFLHAYITTQPPKGIVVTYEEKDDGIFLFVTNNTKSDLSNAYLQLNRIEPEPEPALTEDRKIKSPVKLLLGASPPSSLRGVLLMWESNGKYHHRTVIESKQPASSHSIRIESTGEAGFWINPVTDQFSRTLLKKSTKPPFIYFDVGQVNAEIQFGGTNPKGNVVTKEFELIFDYDGRSVKVKRIYE